MKAEVIVKEENNRNIFIAGNIVQSIATEAIALVIEDSPEVSTNFSAVILKTDCSTNFIQPTLQKHYWKQFHGEITIKI